MPWREWLGIVGEASQGRRDVLFLDPGLGTQVKAGLHTWMGTFCL